MTRSTQYHAAATIDLMAPHADILKLRAAGDNRFNEDHLRKLPFRDHEAEYFLDAVKLYWLLRPYVLPTEEQGLEDLESILTIKHRGPRVFLELFGRKVKDSIRFKVDDCFQNLALIFSDIYATQWDSWLKIGDVEDPIEAHNDYIMHIMNKVLGCLKNFDKAPIKLKAWAHCAFNEHFRDVIPSSPCPAFTFAVPSLSTSTQRMPARKQTGTTSRFFGPQKRTPIPIPPFRFHPHLPPLLPFTGSTTKATQMSGAKSVDDDMNDGIVDNNTSQDTEADTNNFDEKHQSDLMKSRWNTFTRKIPPHGFKPDNENHDDEADLMDSIWSSSMRNTLLDSVHASGIHSSTENPPSNLNAAPTTLAHLHALPYHTLLPTVAPENKYWFDANNRFDPRKPNLDMNLETINNLRKTYQKGKFNEAQLYLLGCGTITAWRHDNAARHFLAVATVLWSTAVHCKLNTFNNYVTFTKSLLAYEQQGTKIVLDLFCNLAKRVLLCKEHAVVVLATLVKDLHELLIATPMTKKRLDIVLKQLWDAKNVLKTWAEKTAAEAHIGHAKADGEDVDMDDMVQGQPDGEKSDVDDVEMQEGADEGHPLAL